jgi:hypothetical protein
VAWGVVVAGRAVAGATPGRGPPPAEWRGVVVLSRSGPLSRAGEQLAVTLLRVACHCWGLTHCCLRDSPGGRPRDVAACRGRPQVDASRSLCAGFRQCG